MLNLDYIDLYLIHSPWSLVPLDDPWEADKSKCYAMDDQGRLKMGDFCPTETWKELEKLVDEGKIKSLGVSNFSQNQIQDIIDNCKHRPQVNQGKFGYADQVHVYLFTYL